MLYSYIYAIYIAICAIFYIAYRYIYGGKRSGSLYPDASVCHSPAEFFFLM